MGNCHQMDGRQRQADCQASKTPRCASVRDTRTPERTFAAVRSEPRRTGWAAAWNGKPYPFAAKGRRRLADEAEHTTPHPTGAAEVLGNHSTQGAACFCPPALRRSGTAALQCPRNLADADGVDQVHEAAERPRRSWPAAPGAGSERAKKATHKDRQHRQEPADKLLDTRSLWQAPPRPPVRSIPTATAAVLATPRCGFASGRARGAIQVLMPRRIKINHVHACIQKEEYFVL